MRAAVRLLDTIPTNRKHFGSFTINALWRHYTPFDKRQFDKNLSCFYLLFTQRLFVLWTHQSRTVGPLATYIIRNTKTRLNGLFFWPIIEQPLGNQPHIINGSSAVESPLTKPIWPDETKNPVNAKNKKSLFKVSKSDIEDALAIKKAVFSIILNSEEEKRCKKKEVPESTVVLQRF